MIKVFIRIVLVSVYLLYIIYGSVEFDTALILFYMLIMTEKTTTDRVNDYIKGHGHK
jgi:hypothetical protein